MIDERWHRPGLTGPILLIVIGLILLLSTLNLLQVNWWELWRLWPLILVLAGLDILSRHSRWASAIVLVLSLAVVGAVFYLVVTRPEPLQPYFSARGGPHAVYPVSEDLAGARRVDVHIRMGLGDLRVAALDDSPHFFEGNLNYPERFGAAPYVSYRVSSGVGDLRLESRSTGSWVVPFVGGASGETWSVRLSREVPLNIDLDAGASSSVLDLSHLQLEELRVRAGVGRLEVLFPAKGDRMTARVQGGVGELVLRIPESLAARICVEGGLGGQYLAARFERVGDRTYESPGYGAAASRLDVYVEGGVGTLRVE